MAKKSNAKDIQIWRDRSAVLAPFFGLVVTEDDFNEQMDRAEIPPYDRGRWVNEGSDATTHTYTNKEGKMCCLVALATWEGRDPVGIVGLLIHEAVHVWQHMCENIGEKNPSSEFEAYSIQWISQELMRSFSEQTNYGAIDS